MKHTIDSLQSKPALNVNLSLMENARAQQAKENFMEPKKGNNISDIEAAMMAIHKSREDKSKKQWFGNKKIERTTFPKTPSSYTQKKDSIKEIMSRVGFRNTIEFMVHFFDDLNWMIPGDLKNDPLLVSETRDRLIYEFKTKMVNYKKYYSFNTDGEIWEILENKFRGQYWSLVKLIKKRDRENKTI